MFAAHIREADGITQSVKEHSENTTRLACEFAAEAGLSAIAELAGTAHDFGKLCGDFDAYISGAKQFRRGEIDHA